MWSAAHPPPLLLGSNCWLISQLPFACLLVGQPKDFRLLCGALGKPEWADDPRFKSHGARLKNYPSVFKPLMAEVMATRTRDEWLAILQPLGVPCGPVNSVAEALQDPSLRQRHMVGRVYDRTLKREWTVPGSAIKISGFADSDFRGVVHGYDEDGDAIRAKL